MKLPLSGHSKAYIYKISTLLPVRKPFYLASLNIKKNRIGFSFNMFFCSDLNILLDCKPFKPVDGLMVLRNN
jgi:hypothetical protein